MTDIPLQRDTALSALPVLSNRSGVWLGALFSLVAAVVLFTRFSIDARISRDQAIFAYGAQQLIKGVPYYQSIFDAKTPLGPMLAGLGAGIAKIVGANDLDAMRIAFFLLAWAAVLGVYLLALRLWGSVLAAVVSAVAFASLRGFATDALGGPDVKTAGVTFSVFGMLLLAARRWFWAGVMGGLAFLVWQPFGIYALVAVLAAFVTEDRGGRWRASGRAAAGAVIPVLAMTAYFWIAGALSRFVEAAFTFPFEGVQRGHETLTTRFDDVVTVVNESYPALHSTLFWGGLAALVVLTVLAVVREPSGLRESVRNPLVCAVMASLIPFALYTATDFQGYPDLYPYLAYAGLGVGGVWALAARGLDGRWPGRAAMAAGAAVVAILFVAAWTAYATHHVADGLSEQKAGAAAIERIVGPHGQVYAIGDPTPLVLTHRRNPDRYIYLGSGVLEWMLDRTGGYPGWEARIQAADPGVIVVHDIPFKEPDQLAFWHWLNAHYQRRYVGPWRLFVKPALLRRAEAGGLVLSKVSQPLYVPKGRA